MASNITVSGLVVAPGVQQTYAQWEISDPNVNGLPYLQLDRVELWAATTNDRGAAVKVADGVTFANYIYEGFLQRYHWIRARDKSGQTGAWYPASANEGIVAGGVWQDFTPSVYAQSGTISDVDVLLARYFRLGPNITVAVQFLISENGSGSGNIKFDLPAASVGTNGLLHGFVNDSGHSAIFGVTSAGIASLLRYDGTYPGSDGAVIFAGGTYEGFAPSPGEG